MLNSGDTWKIAFKVARWVTLTALLLTVLPMLALLFLGIFILVPKGRTWSGYWGHTLAEGTRAIWHWIFGPPKVRIHRPPHRHALNRRRRFTNWRN
jgi:hypothetical protein